MLQTLSEPSSFSIANSICSESVKYSAWSLDAAKVHGQRFWGHHNGLKTCKWRQKMMNYPIKPLTIQLEYTPTGMDEEKDTLFHSDVIPHEIDDWMNSFDNFHTKCLPPNVQFLKICAAEPFLCRWGEGRSLCFCSSITQLPTMNSMNTLPLLWGIRGSCSELKVGAWWTCQRTFAIRISSDQTAHRLWFFWTSVPNACCV